jgi:hypothetical protein
MALRYTSLDKAAPLLDLLKFYAARVIWVTAATLRYAPQQKVSEDYPVR